MNETKNNVKNFIENTGLKLTPKRKKVLQIFLQNKNKHLSAENIYLLIKENNNSIGMATIYRTLNLFVEKGIIIKRDFDDKSSRYEFINKEEKSKHHHLICKNCGKVIEKKGLLPDDLKETLLKKEGFKVVNHSLKIYGYCKECRNDHK
ncbi:MAG: Fur family transcriptional regulator [bacterium]